LRLVIDRPTQLPPHLTPMGLARPAGTQLESEAASSARHLAA